MKLQDLDSNRLVEKSQKVFESYFEKKVDFALSNSFAFGNNNACLIFSAYK